MSIAVTDGSSATDRPSASDNVFLGLNTEKLANRGLAILIVYAVVRSLVAAASRPFWYDELCTWILIHQPSVRAIWSALERGVDSQGPPFYLIERALSAMIPNEEIALRVPSIFGYCCLTICIFVFVRRRSGSACALICAVLPLMTVLFDVYAIEARAYCLFVAFDAAALVCYQRASSWRWTALMAFSLALAESLHYYAVFALVPFGLAEAVRFLRGREFRIGVWLALLCGAAPLAVFWPLLRSLREYYGANYFARPSFFSTAEMYGPYLHARNAPALAIVAVLVFGLIVMGVAPGLLGVPGGQDTEAALQECVLICGLLLLPFVGYAVTKIVHGGLVGRYVLPTVLGIPLGVGYLLPRLGRRSVAFLSIFFLFGTAVQETWFWLEHRHGFGQVDSPAVSIESLVRTASYPELPVVVSNGADYLGLVYYAPGERSRRFFVIVDVQASISYVLSDTIDKGLLALQTCAPLQVYQFEMFASQHRRFLLYSSGSGYDWWPSRLVHDKYFLQVVAADGDRRIYLVDLNEKLK